MTVLFAIMPESCLRNWGLSRGGRRRYSTLVWQGEKDGEILWSASQTTQAWGEKQYWAPLNRALGPCTTPSVEQSGNLSRSQGPWSKNTSRSRNCCRPLCTQEQKGHKSSAGAKITADALDGEDISLRDSMRRAMVCYGVIKVRCCLVSKPKGGEELFFIFSLA